MPVLAPSAPTVENSTDVSGGLVLGVEAIAAARARSTQPSDGGSTGRTDLNDG